MLKRLGKHPAIQAILLRLLVLYLRFVARTTRWTLRHPEHAAPLAAGQGVILAFWHEHLAVFAACWRIALARATGGPVPQVDILISAHRDGRLIARILEQAGAGIIEGSSSHGATPALRQMLRALTAGRTLVITPDGPRGPRREAAPGIAQLAAASGAWVLPCAAVTTRRRTLGSWDRMVFPLPFSRGTIALAPPIQVPRDGAAAALPAIAAALTAARVAAEA
ncbi:lysophospholipid acyltransferase family protein [Plastoroseomonas arctica]|uniref:Lysophospholipid acyltransferase family protein n=1 Tax=Plastoroseomonas arctica TaxID=1509237 RepID=A0AAF1KL20_9PROT|nr:lysophospholipid acyltransferase family protein [Plastoroseomonas arctica]MBR0654191.1 lysophospholipid acyltransferase family protein [Plastoroseomonas arctica]